MTACSGASSPDRRPASGRSTSAASSPSSATATGRRGRPTTRTAWSLASTAARTPSPSRSAIEAVQSLAVGAGSAWVSVAGGTRAGTLPPAACTPVESGGATPDVLIASDLPLQGGDADITRGLSGSDPLGPQGPRLPRGPARRRLPVLRRVDGADRQLREAALRRERQRVRPRRAGRGGDRPVLLVLRPAADPDPQPRSRRPARAGQPVEHRPGPHAWTADRAVARASWTATTPRARATTLGSSAAPTSRALRWRCSRSGCGSRASTCSTRATTTAGPAGRSVPPRGRAARRRDRRVGGLRHRRARVRRPRRPGRPRASGRGRDRRRRLGGRPAGQGAARAPGSARRDHGRRRVRRRRPDRQRRTRRRTASTWRRRKRCPTPAR